VVGQSRRRRQRQAHPRRGDRLDQGSALAEDPRQLVEGGGPGHAQRDPGDGKRLIVLAAGIRRVGLGADQAEQAGRVLRGELPVLGQLLDPLTQRAIRVHLEPP
jgi:hypothetical protein